MLKMGNIHTCGPNECVIISGGLIYFVVKSVSACSKHNFQVHTDFQYEWFMFIRKELLCRLVGIFKVSSDLIFGKENNFAIVYTVQVQCTSLPLLITLCTQYGTS